MSVLERTILAYADELAKEPDMPDAMRRAATRVRELDAERERRERTRSWELSVMPVERLHARARGHGLPVSPVTRETIRTVARHEVQQEMHAEVFDAACEDDQ